MKMGNICNSQNSKKKEVKFPRNLYFSTEVRTLKQTTFCIKKQCGEQKFLLKTEVVCTHTYMYVYIIYTYVSILHMLCVCVIEYYSDIKKNEVLLFTKHG